ncbi:unnamed protein product [Heligmosomoides polygyrus]|uniref:Reverse transcriptase domain-containing protein n=1 Tax=Heligmosomoides polygyrus TaxID=6339 RepID=A0A3P8DHN1_HELPZ|nr:unnamed protein product [Heligmosomoides polygyrus]
MEEKVQLWQRALADNGLRLNVKKTKFISSEQCSGSILDCQGETIEKVEEFRYLGRILCDRRCSRTLKGKLYRTVVRAALYGSECWALGKAQERQLHAAEMRMLRWACGWTRRDRVRNEDVRAVMKTAPIQLKMREQRLMWYGHVLRRPEDHPTRLALDFEAPGKRPRGAPRRRWKDVIKRDLAEVGATADDALDRMRPNLGMPISSSHMSLKEMLERIAAQHDLTHIPQRDRLKEGRQVYWFGTQSIYLDRNIVYVLDTQSFSWRPVGMEELLQLAGISVLHLPGVIPFIIVTFFFQAILSV